MLKQLVVTAFKSPFKLFAICMVLYMAAHSFFVAIFLLVGTVVWIKKSVNAKANPDASASNLKAVAASQPQPHVAAVPQKEEPTPIKRRYAKSAVVVPLKTGADD